MPTLEQQQALANAPNTPAPQTGLQGSITDQQVQAFANQGLGFFTGNPQLALGAQQQQTAYGQIQQMQTYAQQQYAAAKTQLAAKGINLDSYINPVTAGMFYDPGEGASSNVSAPVIQAQNTIKSQLDAIQLAQSGAPVPNFTSQVQAVAAKVGTPQAQAKAQDFANNTTYNPDPATVAQANAAAARVGAPLPYPNGGIGTIQGGGAITNANVGQAYQNGQLTTAGTNILNSTTQAPANPGFAAGGVNPQGTSAQGQPSGTASNGLTLMTDPAVAAARTAMNNNPGNAQAIAAYNAAIAPYQNGSAAGGTSSSSGTIASTTSPQNGSTGAAGNAGNLAAAQAIIANSGLSAGEQAYYSQVLSGWDPNSEVNPATVLAAVQKIQQSTIDPYYAQQGQIIGDQIQQQSTALQNARTLQTQQEGVNAGQAIQGAQNDLEARGMTFSGQGVQQLGAGSAYAQPGSTTANQSAIPQQTASSTPQPYGGQYAEGLVNTSNRLISTGSAQAYQQNLTNLSRSAETQLGSTASAGMVPGVTQLGGISGSLQDQKTTDVSNLVNNQEQLAAQKVQNSQPLNVLS